MSTAAKPKPEPLIRSVLVTDQAIVATLTDGRVVSVPLHWSYRLEAATPEQRRNYRLTGRGDGVHWPDVDEDLSANGFLNGTPAPRTIAYRKFLREYRAHGRIAEWVPTPEAPGATKSRNGRKMQPSAKRGA